MLTDTLIRKTKTPTEPMKLLDERAAQLKGRTISDFVVGAAQDAAQRAIEDESILRLSAEDQIRFAVALIDPPAPNDALRRAKILHAENVEIR